MARDVLSTSEQIEHNGSNPHENTGQSSPLAEELPFSELLENRLAEFVHRVSASDGKNLYDLLIREVEKPLIKLALQETEGNQVKASQLLGMHRNTLRKKMKELKITSVKKTFR